jgi:uncharacterized protein YebE (UPF0316 family)
LGLRLPLLIFAAEVCVVTLSTIRIIFLSRAMKGWASAIGFFEISIWLFAIGQIMQNLSDLRCYAAFAGGFTLGNYLGVVIHERLAIGHLVIRVITSRDARQLVDRLKAADYGVTCLNAQGAKGPVQVILTVIKRRDQARVVAILQDFDPRVFYSVDELHSTAEGIFPLGPSGSGRLVLLLQRWRQKAAQASEQLLVTTVAEAGAASDGPPASAGPP